MLVVFIFRPTFLNPYIKMLHICTKCYCFNVQVSKENYIADYDSKLILYITCTSKAWQQEDLERRWLLQLEYLDWQFLKIGLNQHFYTIEFCFFINSTRIVTFQGNCKLSGCNWTFFAWRSNDLKLQWLPDSNLILNSRFFNCCIALLIATRLYWLTNVA